MTHFQVIERFGPVASLVACWLETGRTHQIRIHMAEMGHPVVGEKVYRPMSQPSCKAKFHRQALHAQTLGFVHPILGHTVKVEAALAHRPRRPDRRPPQSLRDRRGGGLTDRSIDQAGRLPSVAYIRVSGNLVDSPFLPSM